MAGMSRAGPGPSSVRLRATPLLDQVVWSQIQPSVLVSCVEGREKSELGCSFPQAEPSPWGGSSHPAALCNLPPPPPSLSLPGRVGWMEAVRRNPNN